jgi:penicillin-binding protein 2
MRRIFLAAVVVGLIAGGSVAGVRAWSGRSTSGTPGAAATGSPLASAEAFAHAWTVGDTAALYDLLDAASQKAYPLKSLTEAYRDFATETTQQQLTATVTAAGEGSATLTVHLSTAYFGDLEYSTTLTLVRGAGRWLVTWQPSAMHPEMVEGRTLKSEIRRALRGTILDRSGRPLAITKDVRMLGLNRRTVVDRAALTQALAEFGFTKEQVDAAFAAPGGPDYRIPVGPVPDEKAEAAIVQLGRVPGVILYFDAQRVHPLGKAAAHVVGYTRELTAEELERRRGQGFRVGDRVGAVGLEAALETTLAGQSGADLRVVAADGSTVKTLFSRDYIAPRDVSTTLDANVLVASQVRLGARAGASVVIDPRSSALLALNSSPSFDPDAFERNDKIALNAVTDDPGKPLTNRATSGLYSAGSTFKLVTGAAGLAYGGYTTADRLLCSAVWSGIDPPRKNWEGGQGPLTIAEGLMRSCNTVFYEIALTLYNKTDGALSQMARKFGFGASAGIVGVPDEAGQVPDAQWKRAKTGQPWYPGDEVNLGIGQGDLLITPLQLAIAYSALVAGELRTPVVLVTEQATPRGALPLTPDQAAHLKQGLKLVTSAAGTASAAFANAGYTDFAGKSGTAEDVGTQQHVLFVAYTPAAAPKAVCAVVLDEGQSGSIEAGPIARDILLAAAK